MNFHTSLHCLSKMHCQTCRANTPAGDKFRADLMNRFTDVKEQNFTCPYGRTWGFVGLGDKVAHFTQPMARMIDGVLGTDLQNCSGCAKRKKLLNEL